MKKQIKMSHKPLSEEEILKLMIEEGEHEHQDFKFEVSDARKIAKSLSAFANTGGGRLLIGVKDNGRIAGVRTEEEAYMIEAARDMYCHPSPVCRISTVRAEGKTVLIADVQESDEKPVLADDEKGNRWAYIRIKDENIQATAIHIEMWRQKGMENDKAIEYTKVEAEILRRIENGTFNLNKFSRENAINRRELQSIIARFVRFGVLDYTFSDRRFQLLIPPTA